MTLYNVEYDDGYGVIRNEEVLAAGYIIEAGVLYLLNEERQYLVTYAPKVWRKVVDV